MPVVVQAWPCRRDRRSRHRAAAPPGCKLGCEMRPTCQAAKDRPPGACTASVTAFEPSICSALWMLGVPRITDAFRRNPASLRSLTIRPAPARRAYVAVERHRHIARPRRDCVSSAPSRGGWAGLQRSKVERREQIEGAHAIIIAPVLRWPQSIIKRDRRAYSMGGAAEGRPRPHIDDVRVAETHSDRPSFHLGFGESAQENRTRKFCRGKCIDILRPRRRVAGALTGRPPIAKRVPRTAPEVKIRVSGKTCMLREYP